MNKIPLFLPTASRGLPRATAFPSHCIVSSYSMNGNCNQMLRETLRDLMGHVTSAPSDVYGRVHSRKEDNKTEAKDRLLLITRA